MEPLTAKETNEYIDFLVKESQVLIDHFKTVTPDSPYLMCAVLFSILAKIYGQDTTLYILFSDLGASNIASYHKLKGEPNVYPVYTTKVQ